MRTDFAPPLPDLTFPPATAAPHPHTPIRGGGGADGAPHLPNLARLRCGRWGNASGKKSRKVREQAMGARQSTYRTRDLTQAIVGIRRAGLGIGRVEIDRDGKITVHISNGLDGQAGENKGETNEWDEVLPKGETAD